MAIKQRTPLVPFDEIPGEVPLASVPEGTDPKEVASNVVATINGLKEDDLATNVIWRDLLALSDSYRTLFGVPRVFDVLTKLSQQKRRSAFQLKKDGHPRIEGSPGGSSWIDVDVVFTAEHGGLVRDCAGIISIVLGKEGWSRIWMLRTWLENFHGHGHPDVLEPANNLVGNRVHEGLSAHTTGPYDAIVVGGGQSGLSMGGRLKALGLAYVVLDNHDEVGGVWTNRYESLKWHTATEYGNLPFGHTFENAKNGLGTKEIGKGFKNWAEKFKINVQTGTVVESASWDEATAEWTVHIQAKDEKRTLHGKNLILATGPRLSRPVIPAWATAAAVKAAGFKGTIMHAYDGYRSAQPWAGGRGVVIGNGTTAHDVAEDMADAGMEPTMVQRSPSFVLPAEWLWAGQGRHYNAETDPAAADRESYTMPNKILREIVNQGVYGGIKAFPERFDALEKAGFKLDRFGDIYTYLFIRFGGQYVDTGASARIGKGEIKIKPQQVKCLTADGLMFEDGTELGADLLVLCTGFNHDTRNGAAELVGPEIADQLDDYGGTDKEGELRGIAKPAGHPHLQFFGGDTRHARFFSRFSALQIQADVLGSPMEPYSG